MSGIGHAMAPVRQGPVAQSLRIGFRTLTLATLLLALGWAASDIRQVPAEQQAVVLRFGQVVRVHPAGLVIALPRPIETLRLLPGPARQMDMKMEAGGAATQALVDPAAAAAGQAPPASAAPFLTGDGGVVMLDTTLTWRISDPVAYVLAEAHVPAALRRLYLAAATELAAGRTLDDFMVVRTDEQLPAANGRGVVAQTAVPQDLAAAQGAREAMRGALVAGINARLAALRDAGAPLGVEVMRADVAALLPPSAKIAFDSVLEATQMAEQSKATARTQATQINSAAARESDRILTEARGAAAETVGHARDQVAEIAALAGRLQGAQRGNLLEQLYRDRIAAILRNAGAVSTVDGSGGARVIVPASGGGQQGGHP